jgi:hypothetical protein
MRKSRKEYILEALESRASFSARTSINPLDESELNKIFDCQAPPTKIAHGLCGVCSIHDKMRLVCRCEKPYLTLDQLEEWM